jgi:tetratricopeptide (TPR) repeat protein
MTKSSKELEKKSQLKSRIQSKKKSPKESEKIAGKKLFKPGVLFMVGLWSILLAILLATLFFSYRKKTKDGNNVENYIKTGYLHLKKGDFESIKKAIGQLTKASQIKQRDMRIWAGLSLSEAHLLFYHNLQRKVWSKYRNVGVTLISDNGYDVFNKGSEPFWLESNILQEYSFAKGKKEIKSTLFKSKRDWGYNQTHCGLKVAVANGYSGLGFWKKAIEALKNCSDLMSAYVRGIVYLESGQKKLAGIEFKKVISANPNHHLSKLALIHCNLKPLTEIEKGELKKLSSSKSPNIKRWAKFLISRGETGAHAFKKESPKSNIPLLLMDIIHYYLQKGKLDIALKFYSKLLQLRSGDAPRVRVIDALIIFAAGDPEKAWNLVQNIPVKSRKHYGVLFLWFAGKYKDAMVEGANLPENHPWRLLSESKEILLDDPLLNLAKLWRHQGDHKLVRQKLAKLNRLNQGGFYFRFLDAKLDLEEAHLQGHGTVKAEKLVLHAIEQLTEKVEQSLIGKRLKSLAYHMNDENVKSLQLMDKICLTGLSKNADPGVCSSPYATIEDQRFLLELLLFPDSPEKDLEIVISKALKLIPLVAKTKVELILWKARLVLVQIRMLPGSTQRLANSVLGMVEEGKTYPDKMLNALAPIYALVGKHQKTMEIWRKSYVNEVVHSIHLASFLTEIGYTKESLEITQSLLNKTDLSMKSKKSTLLSRGKALISAKKDSVLVFQKLFKIEKTEENGVLLGNAYLSNLQGLKKEEQEKRCGFAIALFTKYSPPEPISVLSTMKSITLCSGDKTKALLKLLQKIPKNHILRGEGEKLSK